MTEETKAGLKLLAEYMGWREVSPDVYNKGIHSFYITDMCYNTSWDALVPVYAKACVELSKLDIATAHYVTVWNAVDTDNKQAAFEAVVELVKLINKEK
jgi:hypothetical protein